MAANMNKVEVTFDADVNKFTRGIDRMERKLNEFDKEADRTEKNVGKRFDLMDGSLRKVEKRLDGFGDNMEMQNVHKQLKEAQKDFHETGNVGYDSMRKLEKAIAEVNLSKLDDKSLKTFTHLDNDVKKLGKSLSKLDKIRFAEGMEGESKIIAKSFYDLRNSVNDTSLSTSKLKKSMSPKEFSTFQKSISKINGNLMEFENELKSTGKVSNETFYKLRNDIKNINFKSLPTSAAKAFGDVRKHTIILSKDFDSMGTHITANQVRFNKFKNVTSNGAMLLKNKFDETMNTFNRWGVRFRNIAEVGQHVFGGVLIPLLSSLIPVSGVATTAIMGIGGGLSSVAGGAVGLFGVFGIGITAVQSFVGQAKTALQMLKDKQLEVTAEVKHYQSSLKGLQDQWKALVKSNQAAIFNTMTNGINAASFALTKLNPFLTKTTQQIAKASLKMYDWVHSSDNAKAAFETLNARGPKIFQNILNSAGHMGNGMTRIFVAFGPLFSWFGKGMESMSAKFDKWANSAGTQSGIKDFIAFTKQNMPILGRIFGNTFMGIINLFKAFSGQTTWAMKGLEKLTVSFNDWAKNLSKTQGFKDFIQFTRDNAPVAGKFIGNLVSVLVEFIKAIAPISAFMLKITTAFLGWITETAKAHPILAKVAAGVVMFFGALKSLMFISAIVSSFVNLRKILTLLIGTQKLGAIANGIFTASAIKQNGILKTLKLAYLSMIGGIKKFSLGQKMAALQTKMLSMYVAMQGTAMRIWAGITKGVAVANKLLALSFKGIGRAIMSIPVFGWIIAGITALVAVIIYLWKTNEGFRNAVISIWNSIKSAAMSVFGFLKPYISGIWNGIKNASIAIWNAIKWAVLGVWNGISSLFKQGGMKSAVTNIWNGIKNATVAIWNGIKNAIVGVAIGIKNGVVAAFMWTVNTAIGLWRKMANSSNPIVRAFANGIRVYFNIIKTIINAVMTFVKNVNRGGWSYIKNIAIKFVGMLVAAVKRSFTNLKNGIVYIFTVIKNFTVRVWTIIKNFVVNLVRAYVAAVKRNFTGLKNSIVSIFNKVKAFMIRVWTTIKNYVVSIAVKLYNTVRNKFVQLRNQIYAIFNRIKQIAINVWRAIRDKVVAFAVSLYNKVKNKFISLRDNIAGIFGKIKNTMINTWKKISSTVIGIAEGIWNKVGKTFNNMKDGLKSIIGKIKGHINGMVKSVKKGLNKLIEGVNWVGDKLGMGKQMIKPMKLSTGTSSNPNRYVSNGKINRDTMAVVGDKGRGNGKGGFRNETITYPNGKKVITPSTDTMAYLPKGSTVESGAQTQENGVPRFSQGTHPAQSLLKKKQKKHKGETDGSIKSSGGLGGGAWDTVKTWGKKGVENTKDKAVDVGNKAVDGVKDIGGKIGAKIGDVMDYVKDPGKLLNKILSNMGMKMGSFKIPKSADIPYKMMKGSYEKLKEAAKNLIGGWLEDAEGGDGDAGWLLKHPLLQTFGFYKGMTMNGTNRHYGLDFGMPTGTSVKAVTPGTITSAGWSPYGGGNQVELRENNGKWWQWWMHNSKIKVKKGQKVQVGDELAKSGNTGSSNTPHVHFQRMKGGVGNDKAVDPMKFLKSLGGGGSKAPSKWRDDIRRAAKQMKVNLTKSEENGIVAQIQRESNGDAGVTQGNIGDINNLRGTPAQGLLQYVPSTFKNYAVKGHSNIKSGFDQLLAFFNNSNWRKNLPYGRSGWSPNGARRYADGGIPNFPQLAWLAEGGFSESVISHDPANKVKSKAIHDRTGEMLGFNEEPELLRELINLHQESNRYTSQIERHTREAAEKDVVIQMDGKRVSKQIAPHVRKDIKDVEKRIARF